MRVARVVADIVRVFARTQRGLGVLVVALATVHFMASKAERQAHGRTQKAAQKGEIEPWG